MIILETLRNFEIDLYSFCYPHWSTDVNGIYVNPRTRGLPLVTCICWRFMDLKLMTLRN